MTRILYVIAFYLCSCIALIAIGSTTGPAHIALLTVVAVRAWNRIKAPSYLSRS